MGRVVNALFLAGPNAPSLPVQIFSQIQFEADPSIAAASALQIVIVGGSSCWCSECSGCG